MRFRCLGGPKLLQGIKTFWLHIVRLTSKQLLVCETQSFERGWTVYDSEVVYGVRQQVGVGLILGPQLICQVLEFSLVVETVLSLHLWTMNLSLTIICGFIGWTADQSILSSLWTEYLGTGRGQRESGLRTFGRISSLLFGGDVVLFDFIQPRAQTLVQVFEEDYGMKGRSPQVWGHASQIEKAQFEPAEVAGASGLYWMPSLPLPEEGF